jgi:ribonuclease BN (tRNA processing enzyme)
MSDGITIKILGDFGPFSRIGKSIGYQVSRGGSSYLIDCGSPLFHEISGHELKTVDGLFITHCHDDHKRWFTDLALFYMYARDLNQRLRLFTAEDIYNELMKSCGPALDRSLSPDSKKVIDIPADEYFQYRMLGPRARYGIVARHEGRGKTGLYVIDGAGNKVGPDKAKIVVNRKTGRPRMLFKDPDYGEWIEPESFYPFSSSTFYEEDMHPFRDAGGLTFEAVKAPVWHGVPAMGLRITTPHEKILFTSDTVHNRNLWKELYTEKRMHSLGSMSRDEFESAPVIIGDINDYIERAWSEERYREAVKAFEDVIVIHDVAICNSVVHTDYERLDETGLVRKKTILTHSPDRITSEWVLCDVGKTLRIVGNEFYEVVGENLYPMDADIYVKDLGKYYVGYRRDNGRYRVYEKDGLLAVTPDDRGGDGATFLYRVDLYEDISGRYFPKIEEGSKAGYFKRRDGKVDRLEFTEEGSRGTVVEDQRNRVSGKPYILSPQQEPQQENAI